MYFRKPFVPILFDCNPPPLSAAQVQVLLLAWEQAQGL